MKIQKEKNWQNVTLDEVNYFFDVGTIPDPLTFDVAKYMNSYAWGVSGHGIDVRCAYQEEVMEIFKSCNSYPTMKQKFIEKNWEIIVDVENKQEITSVLRKADTITIVKMFNDGNKLITMQYVTSLEDSAFKIEYFFDHIYPQLTVLDLLENAWSYLRDVKEYAIDYLYNENGVIYNDTDYDMIVKGCVCLEMAMEKLRSETTK